MAEEQIPAGAVAPVVAPVIAAPAIAPPVDDQNPPWLAARLERDRRVLLESLGITDPAKAKEALAAARKAEDDAKTAAQRLGETVAENAVIKAELERHRAISSDHAARQVALLTPEQAAAVKAIAGDDAAAQLRAIDALRPTWAASAAAVPALVAPIVPAPIANTGPPRVAPAGGEVTSPPDHKAEYARLKASNPGAAVVYLLRHENQIFSRA